MPTLVHDGQPIRESTIINEYIDQAFPGLKLVPADPLKAARMREFVHKCESSFDAIVQLTFVKYLLPKLRNRWGEEELKKQAERRPTHFYRDIHGRGVRGEIGPAELAEARAKIESLLDELERVLDPGPWVVGAEYSLADIAVAPYMFRLSALGADQFWSKDRRPRLNDWYQRISIRPTFKTAVSWPDESGGGYEEVGLKPTMPAA